MFGRRRTAPSTTVTSLRRTNQRLNQQLRHEKAKNQILLMLATRASPLRPRTQTRRSMWGAGRVR